MGGDRPGGTHLRIHRDQHSIPGLPFCSRLPTPPHKKPQARNYTPACECSFHCLTEVPGRTANGRRGMEAGHRALFNRPWLPAERTLNFHPGVTPLAPHPQPPRPAAQLAGGGSPARPGAPSPPPALLTGSRRQGQPTAAPAPRAGPLLSGLNARRLLNANKTKCSRPPRRPPSEARAQPRLPGPPASRSMRRRSGNAGSDGRDPTSNPGPAMQDGATGQPRGLSPGGLFQNRPDKHGEWPCPRDRGSGSQPQALTPPPPRAGRATSEQSEAA